MVVLGEGVFRDDGSVPEIKLGEEAQRYGISKITHESSKPPEN